MKKPIRKRPSTVKRTVSVRVSEELYQELAFMFPEWGELTLLLRALLTKLCEERRRALDELISTPREPVADHVFPARRPD